MTEQPPIFPPAIPPRRPRPRPTESVTPPAVIPPVSIPPAAVPIESVENVDGATQAPNQPRPPVIQPQRTRENRPAPRQTQPPQITGQAPQRRQILAANREGYATPSEQVRRIPPAGTLSPVSPPVKHKPKSLRKKLKIFGIICVTIPLILTLILGVWVNSLWKLADENLQHVEALSGQPNTAGTTYLIAGSDSREGSGFTDDTEGQRSDTIMLLHRAANGQAALISLPRDSFVSIPGYDDNKLNAAYSLGGAQLLVKTVENLTGLTVDHYVEVGMGGVMKAVDAVDGVQLCLDYDVDDAYSQLKWSAGCHLANGATALAFARMRYADPLGDLGRAERQRQVISALTHKVFNRETYTSPERIKKLVMATSSSLITDTETKSYDLAWLAWYFRSVQKSGLTGTPPIANLSYATYAGSAVLLDPQEAPIFFQKLGSGELTSTDFNQIP